MDYKRMKKDLLLEKGIMPNEIDDQNFYDLMDILKVPDQNPIDPAESGNAYQDTQWID